MEKSSAQKAEYKSSNHLMGVLRPQWHPLSWALLAALGESAANLAQPWPLKLVLDSVVRNKPLTGFLAKFPNWFAAQFSGGRHAMLILAIVATLVIAVAGAAFEYTEKVLTTTAGQRVLHDLRSKLYSRMQQLSLSYYDQAKTGDLIGRVTSDVDAIQTF